VLRATSIPPYSDNINNTQVKGTEQRQTDSWTEDQRAALHVFKARSCCYFHGCYWTNCTQCTLSYYKKAQLSLTNSRDAAESVTSRFYLRTERFLCVIS